MGGDGEGIAPGFFKNVRFKIETDKILQAASGTFTKFDLAAKGWFDIKIPMKRQALMMLKQLYNDSACIIRSSCDENGRIIDEVIYEAQKCHLSVQRGLGAKASSAFKQTEAEARAAKSYVVYFPPECDIKAGDLMEITHCQRIQTGRAGDPMFGQLGIRVALDNSLVL